MSESATIRRLKVVLLLAPWSGLACASGPGSAVGGAELRDLDVLGETRSFWLHVPEGGDPDRLILAFHGAGGDGEGLRQGTGLDQLADELGAAIVYPDADRFNWAEDCGCTNADILHGVNDTAFVSRIIDSVVDEFEIPALRHSAIGFSQGGMFAQRLACQMSGRFSYVAVVAATMSVPLAARCAPPDPLSLLVVVSTADPIFPWDGSESGALSTLSVDEMGELWSEALLCSSGSTDDATAGVVRLLWSGCIASAALEVVGVVDGAHAWQMSPAVETTAEIFSFFR